MKSEATSSTLVGPSPTESKTRGSQSSGSRVANAVLHCRAVVSQSGRQYFDRDGNYVPPQSSDVDYKTYTYNNRRYGNPLSNQGAPPGYQVPPSSYPGIPNFPPNQYNPSYNPDLYNPISYNPNYGSLDVQRGLPRPDDPRFDNTSNVQERRQNTDSVCNYDRIG
ncbi:hypothetical protein GE061_010837 [Apolygus lucorum]|uniref:Uncharacterized protein n=1 Tax=Apolygus lucorum TaxID=248454 RepID=A0A8S9XVN3_APOLU|nr:hypothetical protein GE061_010837 [Apolygus lucorum]